MGGCSSCAHSATLTLRGTAPAQDNGGTCTAPQLVANVSASVRIVFAWSGPASGTDSLSVTPGTAFTFTRTVPPGAYTIRAWAADAGGAGCDTTLSVTVKNPPWRVQLLP